MDRVDELFGASGAEPEPRRRLIMVLLTSGLLLTTLGLACTSAPGGLVVLAAWLVADGDLDRLKAGYLPSDTAADVRRLRGLTLVGLAVVLALFLIQVILLDVGYYDRLWGGIIEATAPTPPAEP
ncbi:MAG TPA: hypothetical protein PKA64_16735 [Myxococcota bacterium]|nr:hypothetical protein [Myxococcota bacterium]